MSPQTLCNRFGQGRLSRRQHQTKRLRALQTNNNGSSCSTKHPRLSSGPRKLTGGNPSDRETHDEQTRAKRRQGPLANVGRGRRERLVGQCGEALEKGPVASACLPSTTNQEYQTTGSRMRVGEDFTSWDRDDSALNPRARAHHQRVDDSTCDVGCRPVRSASSGCLKVAGDLTHSVSSGFATANLAPIPSVRSVPTLSRSRRTLRRSVSQGGKRRLDIGDAPTTQESTVCKTLKTAAAIPSCAENEYGDARACGIVLRLSPAERPLDPWNQLITPFRAMCDIEPSLSRAGIEYRGVIHAVEVAHEKMVHDETKVRIR